MSSLADLMTAFFSKGSTNAPLSVSQGAPAVANILDGFQSVTATTGATTLVTVPQGRTWQGKIGASVACNNAAANAVAGNANATFSVAGAGATPTGNVFAVDAKCGANAATGTVGSQGSNFAQTDLVVTAPAGNAVTIQVTTTITGTGGECDSFAIGQLL